MTGIPGAYLDLLRTDALPLVAACAVERLLPVEKRQPLRSVLFNTGAFLLVLPGLVLLLPRLSAWAEPLRRALGGPIFEFSSSRGIVGQIVLGLLIALVWDFFQYWAHRAMHTVPWLWEIHKLHHADAAVNATTTYRNHLTAHVLMALAVGMPLSLVLPLSAMSAAGAIALFHVYGYFNHLNVRLSLGFLTPVISGPQLHRIHHSSLQHHRDRNFAAFFPLLDRVFDTYYRPDRADFHPTGLGGGEPADQLRSLTVAPFAAWAEGLRRSWSPAPVPARASTAAAKISR